MEGNIEGSLRDFPYYKIRILPTLYRKASYSSHKTLSPSSTSLTPLIQQTLQYYILIAPRSKSCRAQL